MRLRPFFPYYGAKWRLAGRYPSPNHRRLVEPFAGSAQYACLHAHCDVLLVDADPVIVGVWEYLLRVKASEVLALPDVEAGASTLDLPVCEEARHLIGFWLRPACTRPATSASGWYGRYAGDGTANVWGAEVRRRIAHQVGWVRHWRVQLGTYADAPNSEATWFVDPPYQGPKGKHYRHGSDLIDYGDLAEWCRAREGEVVVCEAAPADWLPFEPLEMEARGATGRRIVEVSWSRGFPAQGELFAVA